MDFEFISFLAILLVVFYIYKEIYAFYINKEKEKSSIRLVYIISASMKLNTVLFAERDADRLINEKNSSYLSDNCYFQIQLTMGRIQSALALRTINRE